MATRSSASLEVARTLFRRCVQCPSDAPVPSCPTCPDGQICQFNALSCNACPHTTCVTAPSDGTATPTPAPSGPSAAGPIAGGVIGGIFVIALVTFLVWRFCIKGRRRPKETGLWDDYNMGSEKDAAEVRTMPRSSHRSSHRASTHTVASFASSALTRASNIIPIAYIPGVTNRSVHSSQDLVPPVPPIPAASPGGSPLMNEAEESHYFVPRNLHHSTYTEDQRRSLARTSIASTIYRNNAIVSPIPAQMVSRARPTAVSVRSNGTARSPGISRSNTPPVPAVPTSARTLDSTQSSIVGRVGVPRPVQIKRSGSLRKKKGHSHIYELDGTDSDPSLSRKPSADASALSPTTDASGESDAELDAGRALMQKKPSASSSRSATATAAAANNNNNHRPNSLGMRATMETVSDYYAHSPSSPPSEFGGSDAGGGPRLHTQASLNQIIEEAAMQASRGDLPLSSPFSDEHAARTP